MQTLKKTRQELAIIRKKGDQDLIFFTRFFYKELRGAKFIVNDHHIELSKHFEDVSNYKVKLLNVNIPPRHSKTELALNFIARGIGQNPSSNWLYISASDELRSEASTRIRDIINHPYFKIMYGVEIKKDQNSKNLWRTTKGGGLKTATIFGQVTGFGAGQMTQEGFGLNVAKLQSKLSDPDIELIEPSVIDLIRNFEGSQVWDDLNKTEDSEAENANNDKVSRVIFNTLLSRENSHDTPIIHIQQRTGMSDATASLMEHYGLEDPKYRFVVMPIIKEDGTPLWEAKYPMDEILKLKNSPKTAHIFDTQYMQDPNPSDEIIFPKKELQFFTMEDINVEDKESVINAVDVADEGDDSLSSPLGYLYGERVYIVDWIFTKDGMQITVPQTGSFINHHKVNHSVIETNNHGVAFVNGVSKYVSKTNIITVFNTANKHSRIVNEARFIKLHFVFRSDVDPNSDYAKAMKQLTRYKKKKSGNAKDDAPDSLSLLSQVCRDLFQDRFH